MMTNPIKNTVVGITFFLASLLAHTPAEATPLHDAALNGDVELAELLIANGADVDTRDVHGYTPLHLAIQEGHTQVAKVLIENGADVNARLVGEDGNDYSPLYLSIILGRGAVESLLMGNGAQK